MNLAVVCDSSNFFMTTPLKLIPTHSVPKVLGRLLPTEILHLTGSEMVIKSADKGSGTVVMDREWYINERLRQLNDTLFYKTLLTTGGIYGGT